MWRREHRILFWYIKSDYNLFQHITHTHFPRYWTKRKGRVISAVQFFPIHVRQVYSFYAPTETVCPWQSKSHLHAFQNRGLQFTDDYLRHFILEYIMHQRRECHIHVWAMPAVWHMAPNVWYLKLDQKCSTDKYQQLKDVFLCPESCGKKKNISITLCSR